MAHGGAGSPDFRAAIAALTARTMQGVVFGLDRTFALLDACGSPHERLRALHIAGTNGKGSTCATLDAVLQAQGFRTGRYASPHLINFTERVLVNGAAVSEMQMVQWIAAHQSDIDAIGATFFEATTVMALDLLAQAEVDVAVIEVGLGGRLDSTNVLTPLVAGVTAIGIDHREFLGDTLPEIAREKAGIFKPGVPAVIGERDPAVIEVLREAAVAAGATPIIVCAETLPVRSVALTPQGTAMLLGTGQDALELTTALVGEHQAQNVATAVAVLRVAGAPWMPSTAVLQQGLRETRLAGRFQRVGPWLFDVAHNPDGIRTVVRSLQTVRPPGPVGAVLCVLSDKDWRAMIDALLPVIEVLWLTDAPAAPASRRWPLDEAVAYAKQRAGDRVRVVHAPISTQCWRRRRSRWRPCSSPGRSTPSAMRWSGWRSIPLAGKFPGCLRSAH